MDIKNNIPESRRLKTGRKTIEKMIQIYCNEYHISNGSICDECTQLRDYAFRRLINCPYREDKPACSECPIHCYNKDMRQKIKSVMRYSGPRLIFKHPYLALMHLLQERTDKASVKD